MFSIFRVSTFGFLPTEIKTLSNTFSIVSTSLSIFTFSLFSSNELTFVTFEESKIDSNCFFNFLLRGFIKSGSAPGTKLGKNSTTVTFEPKAAYTCPNSKPIIPPPTTKKFSGTLSRSKAVFDVKIDLLFLGSPGIKDEEEPDAIIQSLN